MALLEVRDAKKSFGGVKAVDGCTFSVEEGTITALIGPNGAGKTTMFNMINGLHRADGGDIRFEGKPIQRLMPHRITRLGISRTFQISRQLGDLNVLENVVVQSPARGLSGLMQRAVLGEERDRAMALLEFVGIADLAHQSAAKLSYGQKKLMDIAAGMMARPRLFLLDEPAGGINPALLELIIDRVQKLRDDGVTFLIVEHNMVMAYGKVLAEGPPAAIQANNAVLEAYLGG
jgi:branched-chain amino acid transport system ATP-binding protein